VRNGSPLDPDELLTAEDVAGLMKVERATFLRWVRQGDFPPGFFVHGRERRWTVLDYRGWVDQKRRQAAGSAVDRPPNEEPR
jgi:predicted DNA-binding transcriptional regulator AlpA